MSSLASRLHGPGRTLVNTEEWFIAIMLLGNMAMAVYVLIELRRMGTAGSIEQVLTRRNP